MSCYQLIKNFIFPNILMWQSNLATIIFVTFICSIAMYFYGEYIREADKRIMLDQILIEREKRYLTLLESMQEGVIIISSDNVIQYTNPMVCTILGYSNDELVGHNVVELLDTENMHIIQEQIANRKKGISGKYELSLRKINGGIAVFLVSAHPIYNENGLISGSFGVLTDIAERKSAEEKFRGLAESSADAIMRYDRNYRHLYVNRAGAEAAGLSGREFHWEDLPGAGFYRESAPYGKRRSKRYSIPYRPAIGVRVYRNGRPELFELAACARIKGRENRDRPGCEPGHIETQTCGRSVAGKSNAARSRYTVGFHGGLVLGSHPEFLLFRQPGLPVARDRSDSVHGEDRRFFSESSSRGPQGSRSGPGENHRRRCDVQSGVPCGLAGQERPLHFLARQIGP